MAKKRLICKKCHLENIPQFREPDDKSPEDMTCVYCGGECEYIEEK